MGLPWEGEPHRYSEHVLGQQINVASITVSIKTKQEQTKPRGKKPQ